MEKEGWREVLLDQPFGGKWSEVNMSMEGGSHHHATSFLQGTRISDFAGGFSYQNNNRFIHW